MVANFNYAHFLNHAIGKKALDSFYEIVSTCKKKFLITLDGFDNAFAEYRKRTHFQKSKDEDRYKIRLAYERYWLTSFLFTVIDIKNLNQKDRFYKLIDFCVTIPRDRFLEIRNEERDAYQFPGRVSHLKWSGPELAILVRKRLEALSSYYTSNDYKFEDRLSNILTEKYKYIPLYTTTSIGQQRFSHHIFIDILRHTFWKPREILWYFRDILAFAAIAKQKNCNIDNYEIRSIVSKTARKIIEHEFLPEFRLTFVNIKTILECLRECSNIISYDDLHKRFEHVDFDFVGESCPVKNPLRKICLLYDLGIIGVYADDKFSQKYKLQMHHSFYFNEKITLDDIANEDFVRLNYIIHPIFYEWLSIEVQDKEFVLGFDWDYLKKNEKIRFAHE